MAIGALTPPQTPTALGEVLIEFPDNRLLIDLCGEYDRNLTEIEQKLSVQILRRGNLLAIHGEPDTAKRAEQVLKALYARLEAGKAVEAGDIDREFRMGGDEAPGAGDQLEMFRGGKFEIKFRDIKMTIYGLGEYAFVDVPEGHGIVFKESHCVFMVFAAHEQIQLGLSKVLKAATAKAAKWRKGELVFKASE